MTTINGKHSDAKKFAFDGCHKIYLLESAKDVREALEFDYEIYPITGLQDTYESSCGLRFICNWALTIEFVAQFEDATFA